MKRSLSLILALVMVLGSFTGVFAAPQTADEAGAFLQSVGVLLGDDEGNLNLGSTLERRDTVVLLSRLMGQEEVASTFPTSDELPTWGDVRTDAYYLPFLAWAETNGYFEGSEGMFNPRAAITAQEYALVLLRALGYEVSGHDAWVNAIETATEKGLLEGLEVSATDAVLRGQMANMTVNALGATMANSETTLAESLGITMPVAPVVDATKVEKVYAENLKEIVVVFDGEVDKTTAETRFNYDLDDSTLEITRAELSEDMTTVLLSVNHDNNALALENNKEYELTVSGVRAGGRTLSTEEVKFEVVDNSIPTVVEVRALGTKAIRVEMSEPVLNVTTRNFELNGRTLFGSVADQSGRVIVLRTNSAMDLGMNELTVKNVQDFAGFRSLTSVEKFEVVEDTTAPVVVEASATLEKVELIFDEDVDPDTVVRTNFYWMRGTTKVYPQPISASDIRGNRVTLHFAETNRLPAIATSFYVINVADYSGNKMAETEVVITPVVDQTRPEVVSVRVDDTTNDITILFNKALDNASATNRRNFELKDKDGKVLAFGTPQHVSGSREIVMPRTSALPTGDNTLTISGVQDNTTLKNTMMPFTTVLNTKDTARAIVTSVTANTAKTTIIVNFDKEMDLASIENRDNYRLVEGGSTDLTNGTVSTLPSTARLTAMQSGKAVMIELRAGTAANHLRVLNVRDSKDNLLDIAHINVNKFINTGSAGFGDLSSTDSRDAKFVDRNTVEVKFDQPIVAVRGNAIVVESVYGTPVAVDRIEVNGTETVKVILRDVDQGNAFTSIARVRVVNVPGTTYLTTASGNEVDAIATTAIKDEVAPEIKLDDTIFHTVTVTTYDELVIPFTEVVIGEDTRAFVVRADGRELKVNEYSVVRENATTLKIVLDQGKTAVGDYTVELRSNQFIIQDGALNPARDSRVYTFTK